MHRTLKFRLIFGIPLLLVIAFTHRLSVVVASPAQICGVPADFDTIQAAVDDPACDTITVSSGIFTETVTIDRTLTIAGAGRDNTTVNGNAGGSVFTIQASGVVTLPGRHQCDGQCSRRLRYWRL